MKKMNKKGFTLMEMLIVIAIIAILIAIAIPTFTSALEKSRIKTDLANARALKSLVLANYMTDGLESGTYYLAKGGQSYADSDSDCIMCSSSKYGKDKQVSVTLDITADEPITATYPDVTDVDS